MPSDVWSGALKAATTKGSRSQITHPRLWERISWLNANSLRIETQQPTGPSGWQALFGDRAPSVLQRLTEWWKKPSLQDWVRLAEATNVWLKYYDEGLISPGNADNYLDAWTYIAPIRGRKVAYDMLFRLLVYHPENHRGLLAKAQVLLAKDDPSGLDIIQRAKAENWIIGESVRLCWARYMQRNGEDDSAEQVLSDLNRDKLIDKMPDELGVDKLRAYMRKLRQVITKPFLIT